jgi:hypothetical protein
VSPWAIAGRGSRDEAPPAAEWPKNPPPPLGNWAIRSSTVIAPAAISVIRARYRPDSRSAGRPTSAPIRPVSSPAASTSSGNGSEVASSSRRAIQAPMASCRNCASETMPARPISSPRPRVAML